MLSLQVLVATMYERNPLELYKRMNLHSDALIINQSNYFDYCKESIKGFICECYTFNERGLSRSRNNALLRATGDIICLADDDVIYTDTYYSDIINEFSLHPEADAIVFNLNSINGERVGKKINRFKRVGKIESKEYGSVHIAFRRNTVISNNVFFNILFGSGSLYSCGEDTIFLKDLIDKGLRLYKSPITIGTVDMSESSWFRGYDETYFFNKGALIACMFPSIKYLLVFIQSFKNSKRCLNSFKLFFRIFNWYLSGIKDYDTRFGRRKAFHKGD